MGPLALGKKDDVKAFKDIKIWDAVRPTTDRDGKWVYKLKLRPNGQIDKNKAHFVVKNFEELEVLEYFAKVAPTCKSHIFRILIQLLAEHGHVILQFDVNTVSYNHR